MEDAGLQGLGTTFSSISHIENTCSGQIVKFFMEHPAFAGPGGFWRYQRSSAVACSRALRPYESTTLQLWEMVKIF